MSKCMQGPGSELKAFISPLWGVGRSVLQNMYKHWRQTVVSNGTGNEFPQDLCIVKKSIIKPS